MRRLSLLEFCTSFPWRRKVRPRCSSVLGLLAAVHFFFLLLVPSTRGIPSSPTNDGGGGGGGSFVPFCSEHAPLNSKFFSPFFESHREVTGCVSKERADSTVIHVVKIDGGQPKMVLLTIAGRLSNSWTVFFVTRFPFFICRFRRSIFQKMRLI